MQREGAQEFQRLPYEERLKVCKNPLLRKLFKIIIQKRSNLCVALDMMSLKDMLQVIDRIGDHVVMIKTHCGGYQESDLEVLQELYKKKKQYNFLLFEDRKYCEGSDATRFDYSAKYVKYADLVTIWPTSGDESYRAIELAIQDAQLPEDEPRGCFAVLEVSFANQRLGFYDVKTDLEIAAKNSHVCMGIIAQNLQVPDNCQMIKATPGVHLHRTASAMNQRWKPPAQAIQQGSDLIIVGRGITATPIDDVEKVACEYKDAAWAAHKV